MTLADDDARRAVRGALDRTLFVEAGAGTGKTRELVERIVGLVAAGIPVTSIAAITFTEKAATELRDRIRTRLEAGVDESLFVAAALDALDEAPIHTLHGFARRLLAANAVAAGLPPVFEVVDEADAALAFDQRWAAFISHVLSGGSDPELWMVAYQLGATVDRLRDLAMQFHDRWDLLVHPPGWLAEGGAPCDLRPDPGPLIAALDAALDAAGGCVDPDDRLLRFLTGPVRALREAVAAATDGPSLAQALTGRRLQCGLGTARAWTGPTKAEVQALLAAAGKEADAVFGALAQPVLAAVCRAVRAFTLDAAAARVRAGRLEYHDLLVCARDLLRSHPVVAEGVTHVLVDEFQDTDPIQFELAEMIARGRAGGLTFVGDPKQSIYRFRGADVIAYRGVRDRFARDVVELRTNFRAVAPIVDWVDAVFGALLPADSETQAPWAPLVAARRSRPGPPPVIVLGGPLADGSPVAAVRELEACDVAATCRAAVEEQWSIGDGDGERPVRFDDIAILLPSRTALPALERALDAADVPFRVESRSLLWATQEVRDLLAVVRAVDQPTDEVAVVAALRSPLLACDDAALFAWRTAGGAWDPRAGRPGGVADDDPVAEGMVVLAGWHAQRWALPVDRLVVRIVEESHALALGYGRRRPQESWNRTRFFVDQARAFADRGGAGLRAFVAWAEHQAAEGATAIESVVPDADDRAVRVMTIHAAKGLEFPVCVVAGLNSAGARWRPAAVVWRDDVGVRIGRKDDHWETPGFPEAHVGEQQLEAEEQMRLLYVACTRARDHLVMSLWHKAESRVGDQSCLAARAAAAVATAGALARRLDGGPLPVGPTALGVGPAGLGPGSGGAS